MSEVDSCSPSIVAKSTTAPRPENKCRMPVCLCYGSCSANPLLQKVDCLWLANGGGKRSWAGEEAQQLGLLKLRSVIGSKDRQAPFHARPEARSEEANDGQDFVNCF
jgi:hypothetical protein